MSALRHPGALRILPARTQGDQQTPIMSLPHPVPGFSICCMVLRSGRTEWLRWIDSCLFVVPWEIWRPEAHGLRTNLQAQAQQQLVSDFCWPACTHPHTLKIEEVSRGEKMAQHSKGSCLQALGPGFHPRRKERTSFCKLSSGCPCGASLCLPHTNKYIFQMRKARLSWRA